MINNKRPSFKFAQSVIGLLVPFILVACVVQPVQAPKPIVLNIVAINDLHGHIEQEKFNYTSSNNPEAKTVIGGGIEVLGANLQAWHKQDKDLLFVGGGDLIGASPGISSLFADEPTIEALGQMGLRVSALGNHEFDHGLQELKRQINGGCDSPRPDKACKFNSQYSGAKFSYIAANVIEKSTGKSMFPSYHIEQVKGVKIGFIGAVLRDTPLMVASEEVKSLQFIDEAEAINRNILELKAQGVKVFVVLIHEGIAPTEALNHSSCETLNGPIVNIVKKLDPEIKLIISGHSHTGFVCKVDGRTVTQAQMYGHLLTRIAITVDGIRNEVINIDASNIVMEPTLLPVPGNLTKILQAAHEGSRAIIAQPVARIAVPTLNRKLNLAGESPLGNIVADAQLSAVKALGAQVAFMNNKGIRGNLETNEGNISSYGQTSTVFPFGNTLVLMTLTGVQIKKLLEEQKWLDEESVDGRTVLQVSDGFAYEWDAKRPVGQRVIPDSVKLNGVILNDQKEYRIVVNNFMAGGGDRLPILLQGKNKIDTGIKDIDVFMHYIKEKDKAGTPVGSNDVAGRIKRIN